MMRWMQFFRGERVPDPKLLVLDCEDVESIICISANGEATLVRPGEGFPVGAELVFASWTAKKSHLGALERDAEGLLVRERLSAMYLMRKRPGDASATPAQDSGWECKVYRPDFSPDALAFSR